MEHLAQHRILPPCERIGVDLQIDVWAMRLDVLNEQNHLLLVCRALDGLTKRLGRR